MWYLRTKFIRRRQNGRQKKATDWLAAKLNLYLASISRLIRATSRASNAIVQTAFGQFGDKFVVAQFTKYLQLW